MVVSNKTQLMLTGLTMQVIITIIMGGGCNTLVLMQLKELRVEMSNIREILSDKADINDLGKIIPQQSWYQEID